MLRFEMQLTGAQPALTIPLPSGDRTAVAAGVPTNAGTIRTRGILHRWYEERRKLVRGPTAIAFPWVAGSRTRREQ
jgi:hypothetical protein